MSHWIALSQRTLYYFKSLSLFLILNLGEETPLEILNWRFLIVYVAFILLVYLCIHTSVWTLEREKWIYKCLAFTFNIPSDPLERRVEVLALSTWSNSSSILRTERPLSCRNVVNEFGFILFRVLSQICLAEPLWF